MDPNASRDVTAPTPGPPARPQDRVTAAVGRLDELPELELTEHPALFQDIHSALQDALASIDDA